MNEIEMDEPSLKSGSSGERMIVFVEKTVEIRILLLMDNEQ